MLRMHKNLKQSLNNAGKRLEREGEGEGERKRERNWGLNPGLVLTKHMLFIVSNEPDIHVEFYLCMLEKIS